MQTVTVTITGFEELCPEIAHQTVPFGTSLEELNLPTELTAFVVVETSQAAGVFSFAGFGGLRVYAAEPHYELDYSNTDSFEPTYDQYEVYTEPYDCVECQYELYDYEYKYECEYTAVSRPITFSSPIFFISFLLPSYMNNK